MKNDEEKIIDEIKGFLSNQEEPYEEGNWEIFCEEYKRKSRSRSGLYSLYARWGAVAAAILLSIAIVQLVNNDVTKIEGETGLNPTGESIGKITPISPPASPKVQVDPEPPPGHVGPKIRATARQNDLQIKEVPQTTILPLETEENDVNTGMEGEETPVSKKKELWDASLTDEFTTGLLSGAEEDKTDDDKWKFGLELSSSLLSEKMSFGGGIWAEYRLSEKISVSTGVIYAKIDAANPLEPIGVSPVTRKIGVESDVEVLDIPLSITYQVNEAFYTSVGISSIAILDENKSYHYETQILSERVTVDPETGRENTEYVAMIQEYTQPTSENRFRPYTAIGYLNFSFGRKQNIYNKTDVLFEPFLKVPLTDLSNSDVNMTSAGIRLKVMF